MNLRNKKITRQRLKVFLEKNSSDKKTLDLGSGGGYYKLLFPNRISLDADPKRQPDIVGDAHSLPFTNEEFEVILCTEVLEHLINPQQAINEMNRVLKRGGKLILTTRFIFPIHDSPNDYFRFTKYGLVRLFKDWHIESIEEETSSFEALAVLLQRMVYQVNYKFNRSIKVLLIALAYLFIFLDKFIKFEFGDIKKTYSEKNILSSGYYIVARKK